MKEHIQSEMKSALRAKDKVRLQTLRSILSAFQYAEMEKGVDALAQDDAFAILKNEAKKRTESLEYAEKVGRTEEAETLVREREIIESFLPKQLTETELTAIVQSLRESNPELSLGDVMKHLKSEFSGQYDGKMATSVVRKLI